MTRTTLIRVLLAAVLAVSSIVRAAQAQVCTSLCPPPPPGPSGGGGNNNKVIWYVVGGVAAGVLGLFLGTKVFGDRTPPDRTDVDHTSLPPDPPLRQVSLPPQQPFDLPPSRGPAPKSGPVTTQLRNGFSLPLAGAPHVLDEVILDIPANVGEPTLNRIAAAHRMTRVETKTFRLTGRTLHRWRIDSNVPVGAMIVNISRFDPEVAGAQANHLFKLAQTELSALPAASGDQYAPEKLHLSEAHRLATGNRVLVAVIDSGVDASHPDLAGAVVDNLDAATDDTAAHPHGTGMAGAIASRRTVLGTAPRVALLTVRAFSTKSNSAEGTTFNIIKGLDWAAEKGARIVNMSFAGPADPRLKDALAKTARKGIVLIAAAGNAGPRSPPLFPAADPNVIAVTATDASDSLFAGANRGSHIAVAAPGVDVLVAAPSGTYQFTTGTSVASANVSGVAALLIERNPSLTPADVRRLLTRSAKTLGKGREKDFGAGLVDAFAAVSQARTKN